MTHIPFSPPIEFAYSLETGFVCNVLSHQLLQELRDSSGFHMEKGICHTIFFYGWHLIPITTASVGGHGSSLVTPAATPIAGNGDLSVVGDAVGAPAASSMDDVDTKTDLSFINQEMELRAER